MRLLAEYEGRQFAAASTPPFDVATAPFAGTHYPCLLWDHTGGILFEEKTQMAQALIGTGCRYAVCAGCDSDEWHLAFDTAFLNEYGAEPEEFWAGKFVMTTSHSGESPDEVAHFFVMNTNFEGHDFDKYLVLHIGCGPEAAAVEAAVTHYSRRTVS